MYRVQDQGRMTQYWGLQGKCIGSLCNKGPNDKCYTETTHNLGSF